MCGCKKGGNIGKDLKPLKTVKQCNNSLQYYQDLLIRIEPLQIPTLTSIINSQINVYEKDCSMFLSWIEKELTANGIS